MSIDELSFRATKKDSYHIAYAGPGSLMAILLAKRTGTYYVCHGVMTTTFDTLKEAKAFAAKLDMPEAGTQL